MSKKDLDPVWKKNNFCLSVEQVANELNISREKATYEIKKAFKSFKRELFKRGINIKDIL